MTFADLQNRVYFLTGTSSSSFSNANLTLAVGRGLERVGSLINRHDSRWQFDDSNYTDLSVAKATITSGQQDYTLATSHLSIDRIEIKDSSGQWHRLAPIDQQDLKRNTVHTTASGIISGFNQDTALAVGETTRTGAYQATNGLPKEYDIIGSSIFLYPTPNYTQTGSLLVYFTRAPLLYSYTLGTFTDGTGSSTSLPGFNSLFHDLVALWAAYDYAFANSKQNANQLFIEIQRKEQELVDFYGERDRDTRKRFSTSNDSNK